MISIFVTLKVKPGYMDRFLEASLGDAKGSVGNEPGCFRFDILRDDNEPNVAHFYEVYEDQAAIEAHRRMPHYLQWRETVADWIEDNSARIDATVVFPSESGWQKQKPHLLE